MDLECIDINDNDNYSRSVVLNRFFSQELNVTLNSASFILINASV
jgi:hypothetical protein